MWSEGFCSFKPTDLDISLFQIFFLKADYEM